MDRKTTIAAFMVVTGTLSLPALWAMLELDRFQLHQVMNMYHTPGLDVFFSWATHGADGLVPTVLALGFLLLGDVRSFLMMAVSCTGSAVVVQLLKRQVFGHMDRPGSFRDQLPDLHWVEGVDLNYHFSFPSGHSTAAFSMCLALAIIIGRPAWGMLIALLAALLAYSRVYLSQHFTQDILAGAALGTLTALIAYVWLYRSAFSAKPWLQRRLLHQRPK